MDEDELYRVLDKLHENFLDCQKKLARQRKGARVLCLYELTRTSFRVTGPRREPPGHSRDKRWDCYQIVTGLGCDEEGLPESVEVWPGNTADSSTVGERVRMLKEQFGIEKAVFVGDGGSTARPT